jgi:hypothetical protein
VSSGVCVRFDYFDLLCLPEQVNYKMAPTMSTKMLAEHPDRSKPFLSFATPLLVPLFTGGSET